MFPKVPFLRDKVTCENVKCVERNKNRIIEAIFICLFFVKTFFIGIYY